MGVKAELEELRTNIRNREWLLENMQGSRAFLNNTAERRKIRKEIQEFREKIYTIKRNGVW